MDKRFLSALLLLTAVLSGTAHGASSLKLVRKGACPEPWRLALDRGMMKTGDLMHDGRDCLVAQDSFGFRVFSFRDTSWQQVARIALPDSVGPVETGVWTIGDIRNDKDDELVACAERRLLTYRWDGKAFALSSYRFPYLADGIVSGDLYGYGLTELAVFAYDSEPRDPAACFYNVCIIEFSETGPEVVWNDSGRLGYRKMTTVPPDWLVCIGDVESQGSSQLVVAINQSDMSPTRYDLLTWDEPGLSLLDSFVISRGAFTREKVEHNRAGGFPAVIDNIVPVEKDGGTAVLAHLFDPTREILMTIRDDKFSVLDTIAALEGHIWPTPTFWMDPDGKGEGVLQILDGTDYYFYRESKD
jgi:hypothetical protein